jgi:branched-chain amino acid transport system permease protein
MNYILHIIILASIYTSLAVSLDLLAGHAGILSIAQAAFCGLGAYTSALLALRFGISFWGGVLGGIVTATLFSYLVSLPSIRLRGDYLIIATFAFQVILFNVLNNWIELTRGPLGITDIPQPVILGLAVQSQAGFVPLAAALAGFTYFVVWRLAKSPFGRVLHAMREDQVLIQSFRKDANRFKVTAFAVSAALAAIAGSLYAHYITYIDPTSFTVMESILILSMVIIGGPGSPWGPLVGAVVLVTLPEALRFIGLPSSVAANLRQIFYGTLLVTMMMFRPRGLVGRYGFGR